MKKNAKKSVLFRLELINSYVLIRFATDLEYSVHHGVYSVEFRNTNDSFLKIKGFNHLDDAQAYVFENFAWMFIPDKLVLHEGTRLFVY